MFYSKFLEREQNCWVRRYTEGPSMTFYINLGAKYTPVVVVVVMVVMVVLVVVVVVGGG